VQFPGDNTAQMVSISQEGLVNRHMPRYTYMGMCNHTLYGPGCTKDPAAYRYSNTITAVSGNTVTVTGAGTSGLSFKGGYCKLSAASDFRMVLAQNVDVLTILAPFESSVVGSSMDCFAGCNHIVDGDCATVFNNVSRFGGFPYVPSRNIFTRGIQ
jgi:hypothetical protein